MSFTQDDIAMIVGTKELELIAQRRQFDLNWSNLELLEKRVAELKAAPELKVVK